MGFILVCGKLPGASPEFSLKKCVSISSLALVQKKYTPLKTLPRLNHMLQVSEFLFSVLRGRDCFSGLQVEPVRLWLAFAVCLGLLC